MPAKKEDKYLSELKKISRKLDSIKKELEEEKISFWKKAINALGIGIVKGVGLIIGTTVIAAIVLYIIQLFFDLTSIGSWF